MDSKFSSKIRELRPDWFKNEASGMKKLKLFAMAYLGVDRPNYDHKFYNKIKKIRPEWFAG